METLYFTKQITKGILKGFVINEKLSFPDVEHATRWVKGVTKYEKRNGWKLIDKSFQNYQR